MKLFDPENPRTARALVTLRVAKRMNARKPGTVTPEALEAAARHLSASGLPWQSVRRALLKGGYTADEVDAVVESAYPSLPLTSE